MLLLIILFCFLPNDARCVFHIDRVEVESNPSIGSLLVDYIHDVKGNSIINATFTNSVTITKSLLYFKMRVAEDKNDKDFKRQMISSVLDVDKVLRGFQSNVVISRFFAVFKKGMDLKFHHPLAPVSKISEVTVVSFYIFSCSLALQGVYRFVNISYTAPSTLLFHNVSGLVDFRFVGKIKGSSSSQFIAHMAFYMSYRPS